MDSKFKSSKIMSNKVLKNRKKLFSKKDLKFQTNIIKTHILEMLEIFNNPNILLALVKMINNFQMFKMHL